MRRKPGVGFGAKPEAAASPTELPLSAGSRPSCHGYLTAAVDPEQTFGAAVPVRMRYSRRVQHLTLASRRPLVGAKVPLSSRRPELTRGRQLINRYPPARCRFGFSQSQPTADDRQRPPRKASHRRRRSWAMSAWLSGKRSNMCFEAEWPLRTVGPDVPRLDQTRPAWCERARRLDRLSPHRSACSRG